MAGSHWHTFITDTPAKLSEVNENFQWMEGHMLPHNSGTPTPSVYDLGTSTAQWRSLFLAESIVINGMTITSFSSSALQVSGSSVQIRAGYIQGSASNSPGAAQGHIAQATVSDIAIRANALTIQSNNATGTSLFGFGTTITAVSISTSGNPVLILADINMTCCDATLGGWDCALNLEMDGSALTGGFSRITTQHASGSVTTSGGVIRQHLQLGFMLMHTPASGGHTYRLGYNLGASADLFGGQHNLTVIEFKR